MRNLSSLLLPLFGCTWLAAAAIACGGPAEPAASASDAPDAAPAENAAPSEATATTAAGTSAAPTLHRSTGVYDKEATEVSLKRAAMQVKKNCGQAKNSDGKAVGPWGTTQVQVTLGHNGHTRGATIAAPFDGTPGGSCVLQAFAPLSFPPWDGPDTTIPWDVELVQPAK